MTLTDKQAKRLLESIGADYAVIRYAKKTKDGKKTYVCLSGCMSAKKEKI